MKILTDEDSYRRTIYTGYSVHFQDASRDFDPQSAARWGKAYGWYFRGWLPQNKEAAIVDLGCGGGKLLYLFKLYGYTNIKGVDISPDQVELAKQVWPNIEQADVLHWLKDKKECLDLITALDLIEHFRKTEALVFLDLCYHSLKPGGRLILQTPNADSPFGCQHYYSDLTHEWAYNVNQLTRLLKRVGFRDVQAREQGPVPWGYNIKSSFRYVAWRFIKSLIKFLNIIETGGPGSNIFTRVFFISGLKQ